MHQAQAGTSDERELVIICQSLVRSPLTLTAQDRGVLSRLKESTLYCDHPSVVGNADGVTMTLPSEISVKDLTPIIKRAIFSGARQICILVDQDRLETEDTQWMLGQLREASATVRVCTIFSSTPETADIGHETATDVQVAEMLSVQTSTVAPVPRQRFLVPGTLKVLMQTRHNALSNRGGDTVVMERVTENLRLRGVTVDIDVDGLRDVCEYDLVHLYNFATPDITQRQAENCVRNGVPYVVTTMYEDWPTFFNPMVASFLAVREYVNSGQPRERWAQYEQAIRNVGPSERQDNSFTAAHAEALIATGEYEANSLRRDYPSTKRVEIYHCGREVSESADDGSLFRSEAGLTDFVLCVGRLETRKNQLMLLKALEDSELTLVFATGGFSYQEEYDAVCRAFRRRGKTLFLGRLEPAVLRSAFTAARVHVLPSWFELPGIVSLEAASLGTNVVVSDFGTIRDYLGDGAIYCRPDSAEDIRRAVEIGWSQPRSNFLVDRVEEHTWVAAADKKLAIYERALEGRVAFEWCAAEGDVGQSHETRKENGMDQGRPMLMEQSIDTAAAGAREAGRSVSELTREVELQGGLAVPAVLQICDRGDNAFRSQDYALAKRYYEEAHSVDREARRPLRCLGALALHQGDHILATQFFVKALSFDGNDIKCLTGLGAAKWAAGKKEEGFQLYTRALELDGEDVSVILHFMSACYDLKRFRELENVLKNYVKSHRDDQRMQYCLAGCYFQQEKFGLAIATLDHILQRDPTHAEAIELREMIEAKAMESARSRVVPAVTQSAPQPISLGALVPNATTGRTTETESAGMPETLAAAQRQSSIEMRLQMLEDAKRDKHFESVVSGCETLLLKQDLSGNLRAQATVLLGEALACIGRGVEAESLFVKAEYNFQHRARALVGRGAVAAEQGRWVEAKRFFEMALEAKADQDVALAGLGICARRAGDDDVAWDFFKRSLAVNCENMRAVIGVLDLGYQRGQFSAIEKALRDYLDLHPLNLSIMYSYAGCFFAQNRFDDCAEHLDRILLFEPTHELALELKEKLMERSRPSSFAQAM